MNVVWLDIIQQFSAERGESHLERFPNVLLAIEGIPVTTFNALWLTDVQTFDDSQMLLLENLQRSGLPHCVQASSSAKLAAEHVCTGRGLKYTDGSSLMKRGTEEIGSDQALNSQEFRAERVGSRNAGDHAALVTEVFGLPADATRQLLSPHLLNSPLIHCYIALADQTPVATALAVRVGPSAGFLTSLFSKTFEDGALVA